MEPEVLRVIETLYPNNLFKAIVKMNKLGILDRWSNIKKCVLSQLPVVHLSCDHEECIQFISENANMIDRLDLDGLYLYRISNHYERYKLFIVTKDNPLCLDPESLFELCIIALDNEDKELVSLVSLDVLVYLWREMSTESSKGTGGRHINVYSRLIEYGIEHEIDDIIEFNIVTTNT